MPRDVIKYGPDVLARIAADADTGTALAARPFHYDEGHDDAIASVRDLLCGDGCGEVLWELWPWCLAHNLALAGGMCEAYLEGYVRAAARPGPAASDEYKATWDETTWYPNVKGRPAPGREGE